MQVPAQPVPRRRSLRRVSLIAGLAVSLLAVAPVGHAAVAPSDTAGAVVSAPAADRTSPIEARRVDGVDVKIDWFPCGPADCATVRLPLDYDEPAGATIAVSMTRVKATNPAQRIGTLFWNPGGPGASAAQSTPFFAEALGHTVTARFDVIGIDPRGVGASAQLRCFPSAAAQLTFYAQASRRNFPFTSEQERQAIADARDYGASCSTHGQPLVGAVSTAQTARDMEVIRQAVGDKALNYLGFSYGTYLGQVYANLFPDRVRTLVIDGVLDPLAWAGTPQTESIPVTERLGSGAAGWRAFQELDKRCAALGPRKCGKPGEMQANFALVAERLKVKPVTFEDGARLTYDRFVALTQQFLLSAPGETGSLASYLQYFAGATDPAIAADAPARTQALQRLRALAVDAGFPYDNSLDGYQGVLCDDTRNAVKTSELPAVSAASAKRAPHYGPLWLWAAAPCASDAWTAQDDDAYRGPFTRRTSAPVLVIGNYWDPSTPYEGAKAAARLLPNSRLLSGDIWGHTAYGKSSCTNRAVNWYLITQQLPAVGTVCTSKDPFWFLDHTIRVGTARQAESAAVDPGDDPYADGRLPPVAQLLP